MTDNITRCNENRLGGNALLSGLPARFSQPKGNLNQAGRSIVLMVLSHPKYNISEVTMDGRILKNPKYLNMPATNGQRLFQVA